MSVNELSTKKVLIIEDDLDMAEAIQDKIESLSPVVNCHIVADPYEALNCLSDNDYDYVLVDQKLPGMTGSNVLSKVDEYIDVDPIVSESGRFSVKIPTILMSGSEIQFSDDYNLNYFEIKQVLNKKRGLDSFLQSNFLLEQ